MMKDGKCVYGGMIEIEQKKYEVVDSSDLVTYTINFNRYYGSDGECSVNYEISPLNYIYEKFDRLVNNLGYESFKSGIITFADGVEDVSIQFTLTNLNSHLYHNFSKKHNQFQIEIYNPKGGCIIGEISYSILTIYDSE